MQNMSTSARVSCSSAGWPTELMTKPTSASCSSRADTTWGVCKACTFTCTCGYSAEAGHGARQHFAAERKHRQHLQPVGRLAVAQIGRQALHLVQLLEQFLDVREQRQGLVRRREPPVPAGTAQSPAAARHAAACG
jgi:hypothetical protein